MKGPLMMLLLLSAVAAAREVTRENPLGQVLALLDSLAAKVQAEGEAEAAAYKKFVEWCDDASKNKNFEIQTATSTKGKLEATISKASDDASASTSKIEELAGSISTDQADLKAATHIREKELAEFTASQGELVDSVDTLGRAITIVGREMAKNPAAFTQVDASNVDSLVKSLTIVVDAASFGTADRQRLVALVQSHQGSEADDDEPGAPAAAAYKSHSTNIMDVLEDLKEKAEEQLSDLRKAETTSKHNFELLRQSLEDQVAADTKDLDEEKAAKSAAEGTRAAAEGDLAQTEKALADAKASLGTANANCMQTAADHQATVKSREEELAAIAKAKEILTETTGDAVEQTYSMFQISSVSGLRTGSDLANAEVVVMVKRLAQEQHSTALAQLASRISAILHYGAGAGEDPFVKVRGLISDLIAKLQSEAEADASEKAYCDEQIAKTEAKKGELEDDVAKLTSKIDQAAAKSAGLKADIKDLQGELATLARTQAEMDRARSEGRAAYTKAKAELEAGIAGVRKALGVLRDYYGSGGSSAALLQGSAEQPAVPVHSKATGAGTGIIDILEVVESDFAKNLASEESEEADAAAEYEKMTQSNAVSKATKDQDEKYKTQEFKSLDKEVSELSADRSSAGAELGAVMEYYGKIKERCIARPETYEERRKRRTAEIAGLKEALSILENEAALVQRRKRGLRGSSVLRRW